MLLDYIFIPLFLRDLRNSVVAASCPRACRFLWVRFCSRAGITLLNLRRHSLHRAGAKRGNAHIHVRGVALLYCPGNQVSRDAPGNRRPVLDTSAVQPRHISCDRYRFGHFLCSTDVSRLRWRSPRWPKTSKNPRRNVLLAAVFVCLFNRRFSVDYSCTLLIWFWPDYTTYANVENGVHRCHRASGADRLSSKAMALLLVGGKTSARGLPPRFGAARLLFGHGPRKCNSETHLCEAASGTQTRRRSTFCCSGCSRLVGSLFMSLRN